MSGDGRIFVYEAIGEIRGTCPQRSMSDVGSTTRRPPTELRTNELIQLSKPQTPSGLRHGAASKVVEINLRQSRIDGRVFIKKAAGLQEYRPRPRPPPRHPPRPCRLLKIPRCLNDAVYLLDRAAPSVRSTSRSCSSHPNSPRSLPGRSSNGSRRGSGSHPRSSSRHSRTRAEAEAEQLEAAAFGPFPRPRNSVRSWPA